MEKSLVLVKPDAMERELAGVIIGRLQSAGLKLIGMKMLHMDNALAEKHYAVHKGKPFFNDLVSYMTSGPIVAAAFQGEGVIQKIRALMGATNPEKADEGTIRKDYGLDLQRNSTHASDSPENGEIEVGNFFSEDELFG